VTTVTTALRVEPRDIQFSYMSGDFATWDESDDVFIGGAESVWRDGKKQVFYMFDTAPHFRLFADGTFELTVSGHSGRETTYYEDPFTGERELDDDEFLDVFTIPLQELVEDVMSGKIEDAKTQTAILKAARILGI
jgi:hypothetical protein